MPRGPFSRSRLLVPGRSSFTSAGAAALSLAPPPVVSALIAAAALTAILPSAKAQSLDPPRPDPVGIAVVVHPGVPLDGLGLSDLKEVLLGNRQFWSTELRITLLLRAPESAERDAYVRGVCGLSEPAFRHYWIGKVFRGQATSSPKLVYSTSMAIELVKAIPGAIALVDARSIPSNGDVKVRVLRIDGRLPGEPGYPIR